MKLTILASIIALSQISISLAQTVVADWEAISGDRSSGIYGWNYGYNIGFFDEAIQIAVDVSLHGLPAGQDIRGIWEYGFESIWSIPTSDRLGVPIYFDLTWVDVNPDLNVTVVASGRGNLSTWPLEQEWGSDYYGAFTAHELGHQLGLYDEYEGGATDPEPNTRFILN